MKYFLISIRNNSIPIDNSTNFFKENDIKYSTTKTIPRKKTYIIDPSYKPCNNEITDTVIQKDTVCQFKTNLMTTAKDISSTYQEFKMSFCHVN